MLADVSYFPGGCTSALLAVVCSTYQIQPRYSAQLRAAVVTALAAEEAGSLTIAEDGRALDAVLSFDAPLTSLHYRETWLQVLPDAALQCRGALQSCVA